MFKSVTALDLNYEWTHTHAGTASFLHVCTYVVKDDDVLMQLA